MNISTRDWHYKLLFWANQGNESLMPKDLCAYERAFLMNLAIPWYTLFLILVWFVGFQTHFSNDLVSIWMCVALSGCFVLMLGYNRTLQALAARCMGFAIILGIPVVMITMIMRWLI